MNILHTDVVSSDTAETTSIWFAFEGQTRYVQVTRKKEYPDVAFFHCGACHERWEEGIAPLEGTPAQMLVQLFGADVPEWGEEPILGPMYLEERLWEGVIIPPIPT